MGPPDMFTVPGNVRNRWTAETCRIPGIMVEIVRFMEEMNDSMVVYVTNEQRFES